MAETFISSVQIAGLSFTDWVTQNAIQALYASTNLTKMVRQHTAAGLPTSTFDVPKLTAVGAPAVGGQTTDITRSTWTATKVSYTPVIYVKRLTLPDFASQVNIYGETLARELASSCGKAFAIQADTDLAGQLAGLSTVGVGTTTMNTSAFLSAIYKLESRNVLFPKAAVLNAKQINDLRTRMSSVNTTAAGWESGWGPGGAVGVDGMAGRFYGVDIVQSNLLSTSGATIYGSMFAINEEAPVGITLWTPFKMETQRAIAQFSDEHKFCSIWGVATEDALRGVTILSK